MKNKYLCLFSLLFWSSNAMQHDAPSTFLSVKSYIKKTTTGAKFLDIADNQIDVPVKYVADPAYDQTFKKIFSWENSVDGITGPQRIMSILNSIFYPNAGDNELKIREVQPLPNEVTKFDQRSQLGILKFDVACRCTSWNLGNQRQTKIFDVEMQTGYESNFVVGRLFDYGNALRMANGNNSVIVLAFLNYPNYSKASPDDSCWTGLFYRDIVTGTATRPVNDIVDTHCIDLSKKAELLSHDSPIIVGGKQLGIVGREWLKLLSMRHWATRIANRYIVPAQVTDPAVNSALTILQSIDDVNLSKYVDDERCAFGMLQGAIEQGMIQVALSMIQHDEPDDRIKTFTNLSAEMITSLRSSLRQKL